MGDFGKFVKDILVRTKGSMEAAPGPAQEPSTFQIIRRHVRRNFISVSFPLVLGYFIYADYSRTRRHKQQKAAEAGIKVSEVPSEKHGGWFRHTCINQNDYPVAIDKNYVP